MYETLYPHGWEESTPRLKRLFEAKLLARNVGDKPFEQIVSLVKNLHSSGIVLSPTIATIQGLEKYDNIGIDKSALVQKMLLETLENLIKKEATPILENYRQSWCKHHALQFKMDDEDLSRCVEMALDGITRTYYNNTFGQFF